MSALPRRVLFVHQSADLYGSDRVLLEIAGALRDAGGEPIVAMPGGGPLVGALRERGVEVHTLDETRVVKLRRGNMTPRGLLRLASSTGAAMRALDACVAGRRIDLVHSNTLAVLGGALWARRHGVRHVWHLHEMIERPRIVGIALAWLVRRHADTVVCNSHATRRWLLARQPSLAERVRVVWNGVHDPRARVNDEECERLRGLFRPHGEPLAVGLVGRINRQKGQALLVEAAEILHERGVRDFSLVFVGSAPPGQEAMVDELRARIAGSVVARRTLMHGFTDDVAAVFSALDIVCVPSTVREAFGLVAVEAMAASRAVIASDTGGLAEVVQDGRTGLLHPPGDATALADLLGWLIKDRAQREKLAREGRARYEAEFTLPVMTRRFMEVFGMHGVNA